MGSQHRRPHRSYECEPIGRWSVEVNELRPRLDASMSIIFGIDVAEGKQGVEPVRLLRGSHPEDRVGARRGLLATTANAGPYFYRYRLIHSGDAFPWVQAQSYCIIDGTGRATHVVGILTEDADAPSVPIKVAVIDSLVRSLDLARHSSGPVLPRLNAAVRLHA